ncbi:hypothetical protein ABVT39_023207 [Epinephelus coioides]
MRGLNGKIGFQHLQIKDVVIGKSVHVVDLHTPLTWLPPSSCDPSLSFPGLPQQTHANDCGIFMYTWYLIVSAPFDFTVINECEDNPELLEEAVQEAQRVRQLHSADLVHWMKGSTSARKHLEVTVYTLVERYTLTVPEAVARFKRGPQYEPCYEKGPPTSTPQKRLSVFPVPLSPIKPGPSDMICWSDKVTLTADEGQDLEEVDGGEVSSDDDYVPPIALRTGGALQAAQVNLDALPAVGLDDTVYGTTDDPEDAAEQVPVTDAKEAQYDDIIGQPAYIAYQSSLKTLCSFVVLPIDKCPIKDCVSQPPFEVNISSRSSAAIIDWVCSEGHTVWTWNSQPKLKYSMQAGDFMFADGRMDSPGHCAQYCTYTAMDNERKDIISVITVDKRETQRESVLMEKEAFIRTMDILMSEVTLKEICTDAHVQISALMSRTATRHEHSPSMGEGHCKPLLVVLQKATTHLQFMINIRAGIFSKPYLNVCIEEVFLLPPSMRQGPSLLCWTTTTTNRPAKINAHGETVMGRVFKKRSNRWTLYIEKTPKTYSYIPNLQRHILEKRVSSEGGLPKVMTQRPRRLGLLPVLPPPSTQDLVQAHVSRGHGYSMTIKLKNRREDGGKTSAASNKSDVILFQNDLITNKQSIYIVPLYFQRVAYTNTGYICAFTLEQRSR